MSKPASNARGARGARRPARVSVVAVPNGAFWIELLATLKELREHVQRLADFCEAPSPPRRLDWTRFSESRQAAAEGRARYWREVGPAATAR